MKIAYARRMAEMNMLLLECLEHMTQQRNEASAMLRFIGETMRIPIDATLDLHLKRFLEFDKAYDETWARLKKLCQSKRE